MPGREEITGNDNYILKQTDFPTPSWDPAFYTEPTSYRTCSAWTTVLAVDTDRGDDFRKRFDVDSMGSLGAQW